MQLSSGTHASYDSYRAQYHSKPPAVLSAQSDGHRERMQNVSPLRPSAQTPAHVSGVHGSPCSTEQWLPVHAPPAHSTLREHGSPGALSGWHVLPSQNSSEPHAPGQSTHESSGFPAQYTRSPSTQT